MEQSPSRSTGGRRAKQRLCLLGAGAIGRRISGLLAERSLETIELVAIAERQNSGVRDWWPDSVRLLTRPGELAQLAPDIVIEAASRQAVAEWGEAALNAARRFVVCSASALTDDRLRERLLQTAHKAGSQLVVPHGALGGLHALSAASLLPLQEVTHTIRKPPLAWKGTPAEVLVADLTALSAATTFFEGSAREAASAYPANANAVVLTSLAGIGFDRTLVRLVADPSIRRNIHEIVAHGAFGALSFRIDNEPMPTNPKTSDMAALSVVRLLETEAGDLVV